MWGSVSSHGALKHTRVFITFAHWWSLFRLWGVGLVSNMHMFCMGPSKTRVCFNTFAYSWVLFRLWGLALLKHVHIFYIGPSETREFLLQLDMLSFSDSQNTCVFVICMHWGLLGPNGPPKLHVFLHPSRHYHLQGRLSARVDGKAASRLLPHPGRVSALNR